MNRRHVLKAGVALPLAGALGGEAAEAKMSATPRDSSFDPWIELHPGHLRQNVMEVRRRVGNRPILAVIKNNAYGLGVCDVGRALQAVNGIAGFAVVKLQEAMALRDAGIRMPILLMGPFDEAELDEMAARDVMPMVYRPMGAALARAARKYGKPVRVHVCIDTGIGRVGVPFRDAPALLASLGARRDVVIEGVQMTFTEDAAFDREQLRRFQAVCAAAARAGLRLGRRHAASSSALFQNPEAFLDMVRPGMAIYGCYSEPEFRERNVMTLRPAFALRARVAYIKQMRPGDSAGYGRAYKAVAATWLATLPVGHTDGLPRSLAKGGSVRIRGRRYPIVGSISASHCLVEIGAEKAVDIGDEATVFDWKPGCTPDDLAVASKGSVYDLLMHLNPLLPHKIL